MQSEAVKKTGRPSLKTPELLEEFCRRIAQGRSVASVCRDDDMPEDRSIWRWLSQDESFSRDYARAIQSRAMQHADEITTIIQEVRQGLLPPDAARVVIDGMKWTASRLLPKVYGDKQIVEANVTHTHTLHLEALRALTSRRGNESGLIEAQAIDNTNDLTFSGERQDGPPMIEARAIVSHATEATESPPGSHPHGGAAVAAHTALHTGEKPSDPPPPPRAKRKPRAPKNKK